MGNDAGPPGQELDRITATRSQLDVKNQPRLWSLTGGFD
jgi:hypothetical protein